MSNLINQMYGKAPVQQTSEESGKNPNRVAGGLRGQNADHFVMLGEDGFEKRVPTHQYVQALEQQVREQRALIEGLQKRLNRMGRTQETLARTVSNLDARL